MKKLLTVLSAAALIFAAAGCASTGAATKEAEETKAPAAPTDDIATTELPAGEVIELDNFEDGNYWEAIRDSWGDNDKSLTADLSADWGTAGENSLKCSFAAIADGEKAGFVCNAPLETDWTGAKYIVLDVYNPNSYDLNMMAVVQSGDSWTWNQTEAVPVAPGKHVVTFDISNFQNLEIVQRMVIYEAFTPVDAGAFYFDNYRIIK